MNQRSAIAAILMSVILGSGVVACEREGPLEETGEELDQAADQAGDEIEDVGDRVERQGD